MVVDADDTELVRIEGPAASAGRVSAERAAEVIAETVRLAADRGGVALPCAALWAGLAGAGDEGTRSAVEMALRRHGLAGRVTVGTDVEAAAENAFGDGAGVLLIAGTGSVAWGRTAEGDVRRVGGWGPRVGDEGSGWAIGVAAIRGVLHSLDGRAAATSLVGSILDALDPDDARDLVGWAAGAPRAEIAALVPAVVGAAEAGDDAAAEILRGAASALADHVRALIGTGHPWPAPTPLALAGGLLDPQGPLRAAVVDSLDDLDLEIVERPIRPAAGAARLARRSLEREGA